jgi:succinoglycan biosynthesis protein ExoV
MEIYSHQCDRANIGDELNNWFWDELFGPEIHNIHPDSLLVGIGTVLNEKLPRAKHYHIIGSGTGYGEPFDVHQTNVTVHFVRGPLTAKILQLPDNLVLTDPAILISEMRTQSSTKKIPVAFMTHIGIDSKDYKSLIEDMGWTYISPSDDETNILSTIANTEVLITSAMHGAIMADSYRTKWIPIITSNEILSFKWEDWCATMKLTFSPKTVPAYWVSDGSFIANIKQAIKKWFIKKRLLSIYRNSTPFLSSDTVFNAQLLKMKNTIAAIKSTLYQS